MGYTLGQAARAVGMSKSSVLRSIKAGRISAGRDEFGQWSIEPVELHRIYPALTDETEDSGTQEQGATEGNGTLEQAVTGGEAAIAEANIRAALLELRIGDLKAMFDDMRTQRDDMRTQRDAWQRQTEATQRLITDQREAPPKQTWWQWMRQTG